VLLSLSKLYRSSRTPRLESPKNRAYHKRGFFFLSAPKVPPLFCCVAAIIFLFLVYLLLDALNLGHVYPAFYPGMFVAPGV
jgi:hypothetical protein